ncbi:MAG: hypothetical protein KGJ90_06550 [Patescibacteria group bacterium]|nr:hypothetical protein [Patescibacteria group bacterium]
MLRFILSIIKTDYLWEEFIKRQGFSNLKDRNLNADKIWKDVYFKTPEIRYWFRNREDVLLKTLALDSGGQRKSDYEVGKLIGQIMENRIYQGFDVPQPGRENIKVEEVKKEEKVLENKESVLHKWNNAKQKTQKEYVSKTGVS